MQRAIATVQRRPRASFHGTRVLTLESRRAPELALLIVNYGGQPVVAPSVREVPLQSNREALQFTDALIRGDYTMVVLLTGIGTRLLIRLAQPVHGERFVGALAKTPIVARGPKPVAALRELGLSAWLTAPSPNTWREVVATLDLRAPGVCSGAQIGVQEYGTANPELTAALVARGAKVTTVPIYQWALPDNLTPLRGAVRAIADGAIDVLILTAGIQLVHLLQVAADMQLESEVRLGLQRVVVASIGPMTSDELRRQQLPVDLEATHPKMGFLVKEVAECYDHILRAKRQPV